jgi:hypothetical protein
MKRLISLFLAVALLSSCCATPPKRVEIPIPPRPDLPALTPEQDAAIPNDIYQVLGDREQRLEAHIERLEGLIEESNK